MKLNSYIILVFIFATSGVLMGALSGCDNKTKKDTAEYKLKLGVIGSFSGPYKFAGETGMLGVETALLYYRENGGNVVGERIKEDDASDPDRATAAMKKLVHEDKVAAVIVLSDSASMLPIAESADNFTTPVLSTISTHPSITRNEWVSQISFDDQVQGKVSAHYVIDELLIDRALVAWDSEDPHSYALRNAFMKTFEASGGNVLDLDLSIVGLDYGPIVAQLKDNALPFVYLPVEVSKVVQFEQAAIIRGYQPRAMWSDGGLALMMLEYSENLHLLNGMLAIDVFSYDAPFTDFGKSMVSLFLKTFGTSGTTLAALSVEAVTALMTAVELCAPHIEKQCINRMLRSGYKMQGLQGPIRIGENGKAERPVFVNVIKKRSLQFLLKVN